MSYTCLYYHIVFSTKQRRPFLTEEKIQALAAYMGGILRNLKGCLLEANGMPEHLHLAISIHQDYSLSEAVQKIKGSSSRWIHQTHPDLRDFQWQEGYSAFTVSCSALDKVIAYIRGQAEHHRKITFEEELLSLLKKHKIQYDPEYVFG